jgi:hypothetical protein
MSQHHHPHAEHHVQSSAVMRDFVIGMADGLTCAGMKTRITHESDEEQIAQG